MTDSVSVLEAVVRRDLYFILFGTGELESELEELNRRRSGKSFCFLGRDDEDPFCPEHRWNQAVHRNRRQDTRPAYMKAGRVILLARLEITR